MTDFDSPRATIDASILAACPGPIAHALIALLDANEQLIAIKETGTWRYVHVDQRMAALLGRASSEIVGRTDIELFDGEKSAVLRAADKAALAHRGVVRGVHRFELDGRRREFTVWRLAIAAGTDEAELQMSLWTETTDAARREAQLSALMAQVEEGQIAQVELRQQLRDQSLRDEATGLYRHGHFLDQLSREVDLSSREHREFSLVSIALDPPDTRLLAAGHEGRQRVLESLGRLLHQNTRAMDASCRVDDEHFSILLSGVGLATAHSRMDGLRRQCAAQVVVQAGKEVGFTISMGIASFPHTSVDQHELIFAADKALVQALAKSNYVSLASIALE